MKFKNCNKVIALRGELAALLSLCSLFCVIDTLYADQGFVTFETEHHLADSHRSDKKKKVRFRGYGSYKRSFRKMCQYMGRDGRQETFWKLMEFNDVKDPNCPACKPLFNALKTSCKVRKKRARKKKKKIVKHVVGGEEPHDQHKEKTHTGKHSDNKQAYSNNPDEDVVHKQLEPHAYVVDTASRVFGKIAEDEKQMELHLQAIDRLSDVLQHAKGLSKGDMHYFEILNEYIRAPFSYYFRRRERDRKKKRESAGWQGALDDAEKEATLNDLFDF
ncbi:MAG: hypothetical protein D6719_07725 [Candidatus Dadabacteria bacterium]|nr:MAG: hypothetical protein D6719_07725 [Candidatus Dadabacteria bacterium]